MITVTIREAKTNLSDLIEKAEAGEEIVITRRGEPVANLVAVATPPKKRLLGQWRGEVVIADDFDDPVDPETFR
ncbi:MAG: hypothetical protein QOC81_951 [Thermoanaerobaculia bacterium]|jgi:prevent-host-death family protein|nr:hypothetical protein [Thermoanaerobaculia bacterium]